MAESVIFASGAMLGMFGVALLSRFTEGISAVGALIGVVFGIIIAFRAVKVVDRLKLKRFHETHSLLRGGAPSWALIEDTQLKKINWVYIKEQLTPRDLEAARVLAPDFTGDIGQLIEVSRALG